MRTHVTRASFIVCAFPPNGCAIAVRTYATAESQPAPAPLASQLDSMRKEMTADCTHWQVYENAGVRSRSEKQE